MVTVVGVDNSAVESITCRSCAARLEYTLNEVKEYHGTDYSGGPDGMEWVDCPKCGSKATIRSW